MDGKATSALKYARPQPLYSVPNLFVDNDIIKTLNNRPITAAGRMYA